MAGRPPYVFTDEQRELVTRATMAGVPQKVTAKLIGINAETLRKHFSDQLQEGESHKKVRAVELLWDKIEGGDTACLLFYMKARMGWATTNKVEVSGKDGDAIKTESKLDLSGLTDEQLRAIAAINTNAK